MTEQITTWSKLIIPWLLTHGIKIMVIIICTWVLIIILKKIIENSVRIAITSNSKVKDADKKRADTLVRIFSGLNKIILIIIAVIMALSELGFDIGPVLTGAGIVGLAFGFGGQYIIKDFLSGFFIIIENQYSVGDIVDLDGTSGVVEDISLRMTTLRNLDGTVHHIPHGTIQRVSNLSKKFSRVNLNVGISYSSDIEKVISVVNKIGKELAEDPEWKSFIKTAPQFLRVDDFADSSINIKIVGDTRPGKQWTVTGELRKRIKIAFDNEGIEIPFPQVVIHSAKE